MPTNYHFIVIILLTIFVFFFTTTYFLFYRKYYINLSDIFVVEKPLKLPPKSTLLHLNRTIKHLGTAKQIYIINLPSREDRRIRSIALFQTLDIDVSIVPAYNTHSSEVISRTHLLHKGSITLVELACWASHMQIWLDIATSQNDTWTMIFEDDIDLEMSTFDILQSLPDDLWNIPDMLYLGYCGDPLGPVIYEAIQGYRVHRAINPSCTHAYAIRSRTASKLIYLLSSPRRAVDDEIVRLVEEEKLLVFSIHPPLALQEKISSLHPSDVNPIKDNWLFRIKTWFNLMIQWWKGVEFIDKLKDSALAHADYNKADEWRRNHENKISQSQNTNFSFFYQ